MTANLVMVSLRKRELVTLPIMGKKTLRVFTVYLKIQKILMTANMVIVSLRKRELVTLPIMGKKTLRSSLFAIKFKKF